MLVCKCRDCDAVEFKFNGLRIVVNDMDDENEVYKRWSNACLRQSQ